MSARLTTSAADQAAVSPSERAIEIVADGLTDHGFDVRNPAWEERSLLKITNARSALSELSISDSGVVEWEYRPVDGSQADARCLAAIVACLLGAPHVNALSHAQPYPQMTLKGIVGRALASAGLQVSITVLDVDDYLFDTYAEITVTNPGQQFRGTARLGDDGAIWWQCRTQDHAAGYAGLNLTDIARTIALALTSTRHADAA